MTGSCNDTGRAQILETMLCSPSFVEQQQRRRTSSFGLAQVTQHSRVLDGCIAVDASDVEELNIHICNAQSDQAWPLYPVVVRRPTGHQQRVRISVVLEFYLNAANTTFSEALFDVVDAIQRPAFNVVVATPRSPPSTDIYMPEAYAFIPLFSWLDATANEQPRTLAPTCVWNSDWYTIDRVENSHTLRYVAVCYRMELQSNQCVFNTSDKNSCFIWTMVGNYFSKEDVSFGNVECERLQVNGIFSLRSEERNSLIDIRADVGGSGSDDLTRYTLTLPTRPPNVADAAAAFMMIDSTGAVSYNARNTIVRDDPDWLERGTMQEVFSRSVVPIGNTSENLLVRDFVNRAKLLNRKLIAISLADGNVFAHQHAVDSVTKQVGFLLVPGSQFLVFASSDANIVQTLFRQGFYYRLIGHAMVCQETGTEWIETVEQAIAKYKPAILTTSSENSGIRVNFSTLQEALKQTSQFIISPSSTLWVPGEHFKALIDRHGSMFQNANWIPTVFRTGNPEIIAV